MQKCGWVLSERKEGNILKESPGVDEEYGNGKFHWHNGHIFR